MLNKKNVPLYPAHQPPACAKPLAVVCKPREKRWIKTENLNDRHNSKLNYSHLEVAPDTDKGGKMDLSEINRDELRNLLSMANDEWKKYNYCNDDVEWCENHIGAEERKEKEANWKITRAIVPFVICLIIFSFLVIMCFIEPPGKDGIFIAVFFLLLFGIPSLSFAVNIFIAIKRKKTAQSNKERHKSQLPELREKKKEALNEFDKVYDIPEDFCYEYALTKMLRYIGNYEAHSWKEVTSLYKRHIHEKTVEDNTRITAEEATKQTEIARQTREIALQTQKTALQTRNAARAGAVGSLVSAAGILRINSKL